ncbi:MAG TPA: cytochrome c oxidase assembly protein [Pirellulales bacterium]|jgi:cytochrome c oxidase assembly factor CtaG/ferredoxin|nr:cytochrome c oxidase assembly protein [Pirellulales bacterium]
MSTTFEAVFSSWPAQPWLVLMLLFTAAVYGRGWRFLRRHDPVRWNYGPLTAFIGGLLAMYLALASPIEAFAPFLLQVHMLQHLLLMMVVPPLIWLGKPFLPLLRGLPTEIRRYWVAPLLHWRKLQRVATMITHPVTAFFIFLAVTWLWHLPGPYETALANDAWHKVQHLCFLVAGLIFWYPVIRPFPARPGWSRWWLIPFLILADVQNTLLAAWITFSDHSLYPHYLQMPRLGGISALDDQSAAGVIMWVPGSVVFLAPLLWIGVKLMKIQTQGYTQRRATVSPSIARPQSSGRAIYFDLLRSSFVGPILRWRWTRRLVQTIALLIALTVIVDGLWGSQVGAMNLAGVVPWIHWRGLVIFGLLIAGNVFCYGCPFLLPRTVARWLFRGLGNRPWPDVLRTKWLAVALLAIFLWAYEAFSLWNSPWVTAWIVIFYFTGALLVDSIFRGAAFCKYVCPIGQFNFVQSVISPWEVRVREPTVCTTCHTRDCIQGNSTTPGCELQLFQPQKIGNLDCTFCLDCVRACPENNVGIMVVAPTKSLWRDGLRSGIGRLSRRIDYAALAMVLLFGAFANAAGMIAPIVDWEARISTTLGVSSTFFITALFYVLCLFVLPTICLGLTTMASRWLMSAQRNPREIFCRFAWTLTPLGFGMWMAHYSFHFFTGLDAIVPAAQQFVAKLGIDSFGPPNWICSCCRPAPDWLLKAELMMLDMGFLASLFATWQISSGLAANVNNSTQTQNWRTLKAALPWFLLQLALFALGVWILLQPMQMRGMLPAGGS